MLANLLVTPVYKRPDLSLPKAQAGFAGIGEEWKRIDELNQSPKGKNGKSVESEFYPQSGCALGMYGCKTFAICRQAKCCQSEKE